MLVVTRHSGLIKYLIDEGIIPMNTPVTTHATPELVKGQHVIGVLPHNLSVLTEKYTEIPLNLPAEMRGKELTADDVRRYAGKAVTYKIYHHYEEK